MTFSGDDSTEMPRNQPFDDDAIDAILSGSGREGSADLAAFVNDVRMSASAVPVPSPTLAAALATGFSTDKGASAITPASNVPGPARQVSELPKWRTLRMKIKGLVAGLGIAGKLALGASLAAAATTGAGAAGILPGPVQHVVASTVGAVTPFHFDDGQGGPSANDAAAPEPSSTTQPAPSTTQKHETTTTLHTTTTVHTPESHGDNGAGDTPPPPGTGDGGNGDKSGDSVNGDKSGDNGGVVTPTTEHHTDSTEPTTTTTEHHGDGDNNNPESLSIACERATNPNRIICHWTASSSSAHTKYVLLRITSLNDPGRVLQSEDALAFTDTTVTAGVGYGYRVISLRGDGSVESHSNIATIMCCGDAGSGGGGGGDSTTTTTQHHENTTTTTEHHDGTTTTTHI